MVLAHVEVSAMAAMLAVGFMIGVFYGIVIAAKFVFSRYFHKNR